MHPYTTVFPNALADEITEWAPPGDYLAFASDQPTKIQIEATTGVATLLSNYHNYVEIEASATCANGAIADLAVGSEMVAANLNPPLGDVDLGFATGLQFGAGVATGEKLDVAVRVNAQTANLLAFQIRIGFDAVVFEATSCSQGADWKAAWGCTINDPIDRVLVVGSSKASTARGAGIRVAVFKIKARRCRLNTSG